MVQYQAYLLPAGQSKTRNHVTSAFNYSYEAKDLEKALLPWNLLKKRIWKVQAFIIYLISRAYLFIYLYHFIRPNTL